MCEFHDFISPNVQVIDFDKILQLERLLTGYQLKTKEIKYTV